MEKEKVSGEMVPEKPIEEVKAPAIPLPVLGRYILDAKEDSSRVVFIYTEEPLTDEQYTVVSRYITNLIRTTHKVTAGILSPLKTRNKVIEDCPFIIHMDAAMYMVEL